MVWSILYLLILLGLRLAEAQTYSRNSLGLAQVPVNIPANTTIVELNGNNLATADFEPLCGLTLTDLWLETNDITSFPNLTCVGSTLLRLYLSYNLLTNVPTELLNSLDVLNELDMAYNEFTAFPDLTPIGDTLGHLSLFSNDLRSIPTSLLVPLTNLTYLYIARNPNLVLNIEDLSPLGDTLTTLRIFGCPNIIAANFSAFVMLETFDIVKTFTSVMPAMPDPCGNIRVVFVGGNGLESLNPQLDSCMNVMMLESRNNALTSLPNITVMGGKLKNLFLRNNRISDLNQDFMRAQTILRIVELDFNQLTVFPDVSQSGSSLQILDLSHNLIASVDPTISRALVALEEVRLDNNQLTAFPDFGNSGATLVTLTLHSNNMAVLEQERVSPLVNLLTLDLHNNSLTSVPDVQQLTQLRHLVLADNPLRRPRPRHLATLGKLLTVDLRDANLHQLHTMCPHGAMTIKLEGNPALDLCTPGLAWLKQASLNVSVTDMLCPALGKMWSAASFEEFTTIPPSPQPGDVKQLFLGGQVSGMYCPWPTLGVPLPASLHECLFTCVREDACSGFSYSRLGSLCLLIAPSAAYTSPLLGLNNSEWELYVP